jgi:hypothetical protein
MKHWEIKTMISPRRGGRPWHSYARRAGNLCAKCWQKGRVKMLLGAEGFEKAITEVASLEKMLGIYDLTQCTPRARGGG